MTQPATAKGIVIEPSAIHSATASFVRGEREARVRRLNDHGFTPMVLLPQWRGEPLRIELRRPRHPRGLGSVWPPGFDGGSAWDGRVGFQHVWQLLEQSVSSRHCWAMPDGEVEEAFPAELMAAAVSTAVRVRDGEASVETPLIAESELPSGDSTEALSKATLVIPNDLRMDRQQDLIDACEMQGVAVRLLWRPIAAALAWLDRGGRDLLADWTSSETAPFQLACIHLGLSGCEATLLTFEAFPPGSGRLLPARRRPDPQLSRHHALSDELFNYAMQDGSLNADLPSSRIAALLDELENGNRSLEDLSRTHPGVKREGDSFWAWGRGTLAKCHGANAAIVTGDLASIRSAGSHRLREYFLNQLGLADEFHSITEEPSDRSGCLLAIGAATYGYLADRGEVAYLDTLPRLQMAITKDGEPTWASLLQSQSRFVPGGRKWTRSEPITGLKVHQAKTSLEIVVAHEEFPTVRKLKAEFRAPMPRDIPVKLEVSIQPAHGNAVIEVVPIEATRDLQRLRLDWKHLTDEKCTQDEWTRDQVVAFPPLMPRRASAAKCADLREELARLGASPWTREKLLRLTEVLRSTEVGTSRSAVDSDGRAYGMHTDLLTPFIAEWMEVLDAPRFKWRDELLRVLAYSSASHATLEKILERDIRIKGVNLSSDEVKACGGCLRSPEVVASFLAACCRRLESPTGAMFWIKAVADLLCFRKDAASKAESQLCDLLTRRIVKVFRELRLASKGHLVFRYCAIAIVQLLRRRRYDDEFLAIGSSLHKDVRSEFAQAVSDAQAGRIQLIGGSVNLGERLQVLIEYIDRKRLSGLAATDDFQSFVQ